MEVYHLYKIPASKKVMEQVKDERFTFFGVNGGYLYKTGECPVEEYRELSEKDSMFELCDEETTWLLECNIKLLAEDAIKRSEEIEAEFEKKLAVLEQELNEMWRGEESKWMQQEALKK